MGHISEEGRLKTVANTADFISFVSDKSVTQKGIFCYNVIEEEITSTLSE